MQQTKYTVVHLPKNDVASAVELHSHSTFTEWQQAFTCLNEYVLELTGQPAPRPQREQVMSLELPSSLVELWIIKTPFTH